MVALAEAVPAREGDGMPASHVTVSVYRQHYDGSASMTEWSQMPDELEGVVGLLNDGDVAIVVVRARHVSPTPPLDTDEPF